MNSNQTKFVFVMLALSQLFFGVACTTTSQNSKPSSELTAQDNSDGITDYDELDIDSDKDCVRFSETDSGNVICVTESGKEVTLTEMQREGLGPLTSKEVTIALRPYRVYFAKCKRDYAGKSSNFALMGSFVVTSEGKAQNVVLRVKKGSLSPAFQQAVFGCVEKVISAAKFPKPRNAEMVPVKYPISFGKKRV